MADNGEQLHVRMPRLMAEFLRRKAKAEETTPSALVRLAVKRAFLLPSEVSDTDTNGSRIHANEAEG